jgi:hypothetical protein
MIYAPTHNEHFGGNDTPSRFWATSGNLRLGSVNRPSQKKCTRHSQKTETKKKKDENGICQESQSLFWEK